MFRSYVIILCSILICSCSSDEEEVDGRNSQNSNRVLMQIELSTSKDTLVANTIDKAFLNYTFRDQNGWTFTPAQSDSIKNLLNLKVNGIVVNNKNEITSQSSGMNFVLNANVGGINSNTLVIPSYDVQIELFSSDDFFYANGKAGISFETIFTSEVDILIDDSQLSFENQNGEFVTDFFTSETPGEFNFKVTSGSIESNELTINAFEVEDLVQEINIPVVFHVVPLEQTLIGDIGNPTDERIQEGVEMLNSLFSSTLYSNIVLPKVINDVSDNLLASGNISFYLPDESQFDSPGIIRYNSVPSTGDIGALTAFVEENILDTYEYINVFLFPLTGYGSGFAFYPGTSAEAQIPGLSVVNENWKPNEYVWLWPNIHPNSGPHGDFSFNLGKLLAHEIGHYLGLYHVFQGNLYNLPAGACDLIDDPDFVSDTYEYDRLLHVNSPTPGESMTSRLTCNGYLQEANNVMDYFFANWYPDSFSEDYGYSVMFTHQQMERMYNVLNTSPVRKQLAGFADRSTINLNRFNLSSKDIVH